MTLRHRLESRLWGASVPVRRLGRSLRRAAFSWRHRLRRGAPRVVHAIEVAPTMELPSVAVAVDGPTRAALTASTWTAWAEPGTRDAPYHLRVDGDSRTLPATTVETMVLSAVAEGLATVTVETARARAVLLRTPEAGPAPPLVGRRLAVPDVDTLDGADWPPRVGDHVPSLDVSSTSAVLDGAVFDPSIALANAPEVEAEADDDRRTACFLLPYLAVGGAERLLFDLLDGWSDRRLLVVTLDAHRPELGSAVERCRQLTPLVYPLGDVLPRAARWPALIHLLRRHHVETLVSWNGTVDFYDRVDTLPAAVPGLRIHAQLYHHRGGWAARTSPAVVRAVDRHLAVNRKLERSLVEDRGVPAEHVELLHHGVPIPDAAELAAERARRPALRRDLDLPESSDDAIVIGSFLRLHPQKRPLDLVELARRIPSDAAGRPVLFLVVGGGPLAEAVDRAAAGVPNWLRRPMVADARPFYAAVDLCLMTSAYEGLPVFLLDALARGLPIVAPAVGDIPLLVEDGGGEASARPGDLDALEAAIRRLLDDATRHREGERGRRVVAERFGLEPYRRAYDAVIFPSEPS